MGINYNGQVQNGPQPGTPPPPTVPTPGADQGGRPGTGGGANLGSTMAKWRQGIFTPQPPPASMGQPSSPAGTGGAPGVPPPPGTPRSAPATSSAQPMGAPPPPGAAGMVPGTGVPGATVLPAMPQPEEVDQLAPGSYETPLGTLVKAPDGTSKVVLNPAGQEQYRKRFSESVQAFGQHPFSGDPNAPPPPVTPGGVSYNPFTGQFSDAAPKPPGMV